MFRDPPLCRWLFTLIAISAFISSFAAEGRHQSFTDLRFTLERGDVIAFVGGADVAAAQEAGYFEALLSARFPALELRFRNFGWEGDTVFKQPRDVGFPPLIAHLQKAQASVILFQFGRAESLNGLNELPNFIAAYEGLIDQCSKQTPRIVLVTPPPFEKPSDPLPDLSAHNVELSAYANAIRDLARRRRLLLADVYGELKDRVSNRLRLTSDGLQLTRVGHAVVARACARQLGFGAISDRAGELNANGAWSNAEFERLRQTIVAKNQLWFNYWRPQNWAFLGGDRVTQPSSRDHRNPQIRWFPIEMEQFVPLIQSKEHEISELANRLQKSR